jgi:hypothetical protein
MAASGREPKFKRETLPIKRDLTAAFRLRLPLEVRHRVRAATGERHDVVLPVAGAGSAGSAGRWARVLPLELSRHLTGSVFPRRERGRSDRNYNHDDQTQEFRGGVHHAERAPAIDRARWSR